MGSIRVEGKMGRIEFIPVRLSRAKIVKIEKALKKLMEAATEDLSAADMRAILKKNDPLIGTPGGMLRAYRSRQGLTQTDVAKKSGLRQGHLSEMEQNKRPIGPKVARKLAIVLGCDYRRLL